MVKMILLMLAELSFPYFDNTRLQGERPRYCTALTNGNGNMMKLDSKKINLLSIIL